MSLRTLLFSSLAALLLTSCASSRPPDRSPPPAAIELRDEPQISTFHFPRGIYSLGDTDATGYYYSAPRPVIKHAFPGPNEDWEPVASGLRVPRLNVIAHIFGDSIAPVAWFVPSQPLVSVGREHRLYGTPRDEVFHVGQ